MSEQTIRRSINLEDIAVDDSSELEGIIEGRPIVTEAKTNIAGLFNEIIDRDALKETDLSDVKFMVNHDDSMIPIARHRRGRRSTMEIDVDEQGLKFRAKLDIKNNPVAKELCSATKRGDIDQMSFAFTVKDDEWSDLETDMPTRRIKSIGKVFEISAVNDGAYPQTSISARSSDSLENDKMALDSAKSEALENEKRDAEAKAQQEAELKLAKEKFKFKEGLK